jgi:tetratricopeptide (TPR) repeat protein
MWFGYTPQVPTGRRKPLGRLVRLIRIYIQRTSAGRHEVLDRISKAVITITVAAGMGVLSLPAQSQAGQDAASKPAQKNWKDRAEYDLYNAIVKEQDPTKKLSLLNSWKEKYPTSDYADGRLQIYLQTYTALNQPDKVISTGNEVLAADPKNLTALYLIALNVQRLTKPTPDDLAAGEKAANGLISNLDTFFAADKKPATTSDADWAKAKKDTELLAHTTLGWIALQKKDPAAAETAEKEFTDVLKLNANNAQVSYWLGTALVQEKKPEKYPQALFHFARAASLDQSQGGLPPQSRQSIDTYFVNAFNRYHGQDAQELQRIRDLAKASAFPPTDLTIKDINQVKAENEEKFRKENPALALWMNIKQELTGANGDQYFSTTMKGADVPGGAGGIQKLKGKLISSKPAVRPKELMLAITDPNTAEVTLVLDAPLPGKAEPGTEIEFAGVPSAFTKDPFNVTFDVEKKNLSGWPGKEAPASRRPGAKKGTHKKG